MKAISAEAIINACDHTSPPIDADHRWGACAECITAALLAAEAATWEEVAKIAEGHQGHCDCGQAYGDCDIGNDLGEQFRGRAAALRGGAG